MTKPNRPTVRLFIEADLATGQSLDLPTDQSHYLRNVLRRSEGDVVGLFNGASAEFQAEITAVGKKVVSVKVGTAVVPFAPDMPLTLLFAPIKRTPLEWVIAKGTELGVSHFQPVLTDHTQSERLNLDRLRSIAVESAEQSERLTVPTIGKAQPLTIALEAIEGKIGAAIETSAFEPASVVLTAAGQLDALLVGPEGGFSPDEVSLLQANEKVFGLGLGPRILKAETAAVALLAIYQSAAGDWHKRPDFRGPA